MKNLVPLLLVVLLCSCKAHKIDEQADMELRFLDDYIIPAGLSFKNSNIGGLSGIDYMGKDYLLVSDHKIHPRIYRVEITLKDRKIDTVVIRKVIYLNTENHSFFKNNPLDLEGIRYHPENKKIILTSEGAISRKKNPSIFLVSPAGKFIGSYSIPAYFEAKNKAGPRNNGLFEGLAISSDRHGIWVGSELPLKADGPKPMLLKATSPVRLTYYDNASMKAVKQVVYLLEPIAKIPLLPFHINGLSELLLISPNKFLVVERGFSAGLGRGGNTIRIYLTDISNATNTLHTKALNKKMKKTVPAEKKLLFDFKAVKKQLSGKTIDNIEGITIGPRLPNGNKTLLLISDNNFNPAKQLNQIILMEIVPK